MKINKDLPENKISTDVSTIAIKVHTELGPGLQKSAYKKILAYELMEKGYNVKSNVSVPIVYNDERIDTGFRLDLLVNDIVIIEIKSVDTLVDDHYKTLFTYLKLSDRKLGLLINFNVVDIQTSLKRVVNNLY